LCNYSPTDAIYDRGWSPPLTALQADDSYQERRTTALTGIGRTLCLDCGRCFGGASHMIFTTQTVRSTGRGKRPTRTPQAQP